MAKLISLFLLSMLLYSNSFAYNVTVAKDGTGDYTTIQAAISAAPTTANAAAPYTIFIKNGKYKEKINVPSNKPFLQMIGESVANVFVYFDDYSGGVGGTSNSASFTVNANDFSAFNISFANTFDYDAGVTNGLVNLQAVAMLVNGDRVAFKNCRFQGNQDTLYQNKKGYYKNCYIDGIIDFIFGGGASVFDSCTVYPKSRTGNGTSYITAANTPAGQAYGYVFRDCKVISNPGGTNYYLGRPWQNSTGSSTPFAENKTVFLNAVLNANVLSAGWSIWDAGTLTGNITYAEYQSKFFNGSPIDISARVAWSQQLNATQAATYTNANIFAAGTPWDPCVNYPGICNPMGSDIAVSNFAGTKGVGTATFKWNLSWGINAVKMELFRSLVRNGTYTKIGEVTSPNDTTYNYNFTDPALPPGQNVYYYLQASNPSYGPTVTDTILINTKPTINTLGGLGAFLQGGYLPSASQNYTVNGINLSDNVVITCPANYEISLNNATWTNSTGNITLVPSTGVVNNTLIYVRQNASTAPGSFSGNILHTTTNGDNVLLPVSGTSQVAALTPAAYYRSLAVTGNLSATSTWESSTDSLSWVGASFVPIGDASENVTIMPGTTLNIDVAHIVNGKWTVYGTGAGIGGAITIGALPGALTFANNSSLVWNRDGGTLPTGTIFSPGSTFNLIGTGNGSATAALPTIAATQVFHHVIINTPNCKGNPNFNSNLNTINGNLTVLSTGLYTTKMRLSNSATQIINIGGDLTLNPPAGSHATFVLYSTASIATTQAVNVAGNIYVGNNYATNITGTSGTFLGGSTAVTLNAPNPNIVVGMGVTGTGLAAGTYVTTVSGTSLTISANTTAASVASPGNALTFIQATSNLSLTDAGAAITGNTGSVTTGTNSITVLAGATIATVQPGMTVAGTGIPTNTQVLSIAGATLTMSANATATNTAVALSFTSTISKTNLKGNLTINNGVIGNNGSGLGTINIIGNTGVPQYYYRTLGTVPGAITCNVQSGAIFDVGVNALPCITNVNADATLRSGASTGVIGNLTGTRTLSSAANYVFNGTVAQSANNNFTTTTPTALAVNNLTINNAAGVSLGNSLTTNTALNLTAGKLTLGAANLTTNGVTGGSANSYIITDAAGKLKLNNVGSTPAIFPVGPNTTSYNPVTLTNTGTVDNYSVIVTATAPPPGINIAPQLDSAINRTWNISEDIAGGSNTTVTLQWDIAHQNTLFNTNNCAVVHSNGTVIDYSGSYTAAANNGSSFIQTGTGFTAFSPFGVASSPILALPIHLLYFDAVRDGLNVKLSWKTTNESNLSHFEIQRSYDGTNFVTVMNQLATNNSIGFQYLANDLNNTLQSKIYYRLKTIERNGSFSYSRIVFIKNNKFNSITIAPNPASKFINVNLPIALESTITIFNVNGKVVFNKKATLQNEQINMEQWSNGMYYIKIQNKQETYTEKIIKQ